MPTTLITGGTGFVGKALTTKLVALGHKVIILTRSSQASSQSNITFAKWNIEEQTIDAEAIKQADYIVHLAGAGIADKRWTEERKKEIVESRTQSSSLLVKALTETSNNVKAVVAASAIGWYGNDEKLINRKKAFSEDDPADTGFLGETCRLWEESINPVKRLGIRLVKFRFGIVLSKDGGALAEFMKPIKFGVASVIASGKQVISWIHIEDLCLMFIYAIKNEDIHGIYNAVAPTPVTNKALTLTLAQKMKGRFYVPLHVPAFAIKLLLGGMSIEVLKSTTVNCKKIHETGFSFLYPTIEKALSNIVDGERS